MKTQHINILILSLAALISAGIDQVLAGDGTPLSASNLMHTAYAEGRSALLATKVKATLIDHKEVLARYIRVKSDGSNVFLAGFVPDNGKARLAEQLAAQLVSSNAVHAQWLVVPQLGTAPASQTYVSDYAKQLTLKTKILALLSSAALRTKLTQADLIHIDVLAGNVTLFAVTTGSLETSGIDTALLKIDGVEKLTWHILPLVP